MGGVLLPSLVSGQGIKAPLRALYPQCSGLSSTSLGCQLAATQVLGDLLACSSFYILSLSLSSASVWMSHGSVVCECCWFPGQGDDVFTQGRSMGAPLGSFPTSQSCFGSCCRAVPPSFLVMLVALVMESVWRTAGS